MDPPEKPNFSVSFNPNELNQALVCILCFGYFRNAHTVKECLHSFCKSCIYKHLNENMECPQCGKDLQPMPFSMLRPDPVLQSVVDKLFPEAVERDYDEEETFYSKRRLPLPEHLQQRQKRGDVSTSMNELDSSYVAASEVDSEAMSEVRSVDVSMSLQDQMPNSAESAPTGLSLPSESAPTDHHPDPESHTTATSEPSIQPPSSEKMDLS